MSKQNKQKLETLASIAGKHKNTAGIDLTKPVGEKALQALGVGTESYSKDDSGFIDSNGDLDQYTTDYTTSRPIEGDISLSEPDITDLALAEEVGYGSHTCRICGKNYEPDNSMLSELNIGPVCYNRITLYDHVDSIEISGDNLGGDFPHRDEDLVIASAEKIFVDSSKGAALITGGNKEACMEELNIVSIDKSKLKFGDNDKYNLGMISAIEAPLIVPMRAGLESAPKGDIDRLYNALKYNVGMQNTAIQHEILKDGRYAPLPGTLNNMDHALAIDIMSDNLYLLKYDRPYEEYKKELFHVLKNHKYLTEEEFAALESAFAEYEKELTNTEFEVIDPLLVRDGVKGEVPARLKSQLGEAGVVATAMYKRKGILEDHKNQVAVLHDIIVNKKPIDSQFSAVHSAFLPVMHTLREKNDIVAIGLIADKDGKFRKLDVLHMKKEEYSNIIGGSAAAGMYWNKYATDKGCKTPEEAAILFNKLTRPESDKIFVAVPGAISVPIDKYSFGSEADRFESINDLPLMQVKAGELWSFSGLGGGKTGAKHRPDYADKFKSLGVPNDVVKAPMVRTWFYANEYDKVSPLIQGKLTIGLDNYTNRSCLMNVKRDPISYILKDRANDKNTLYNPHDAPNIPLSGNDGYWGIDMLDGKTTLNTGGNAKSFGANAYAGLASQLIAREKGKSNKFVDNSFYGQNHFGEYPTLAMGLATQTGVMNGDTASMADTFSKINEGKHPYTKINAFKEVRDDRHTYEFTDDNGKKHIASQETPHGRAALPHPGTFGTYLPRALHEKVRAGVINKGSRVSLNTIEINQARLFDYNLARQIASAEDFKSKKFPTGEGALIYATSDKRKLMNNRWVAAENIKNAKAAGVDSSDEALGISKSFRAVQEAADDADNHPALQAAWENKWDEYLKKMRKG